MLTISLPFLYLVSLLAPLPNYSQEYLCWTARLERESGSPSTERAGYVAIDWEHEQARCPRGQISSSWTPTWTRNQEIIKIKFGFAVCGACPARAQCTKTRRRSLSVRRHEAQFALEAARKREQTEEFKELYAQRAGVEGVHAQGVRTMGLRRSRYIGEPRTHLQHVVTATAMNLCRVHDWLEGISPRPAPLSHFARFMKEVA